MDSPTLKEERGTPAEVAREFLRLGFIAYGGPAAHVALVAFVGWQFGRAALVNIPAVILAALSVVLVFRYKVNSTWLVLGGAVAGMAFRVLGWS